MTLRKLVLIGFLTIPYALDAQGLLNYLAPPAASTAYTFEVENNEDRRLEFALKAERGKSSNGVIPITFTRWFLDGKNGVQQQNMKISADGTECWHISGKNLKYGLSDPTVYCLAKLPLEGDTLRWRAKINSKDVVIYRSYIARRKYLGASNIKCLVVVLAELGPEGNVDFEQEDVYAEHLGLIERKEGYSPNLGRFKYTRKYVTTIPGELPSVKDESPNKEIFKKLSYYIVDAFNRNDYVKASIIRSLQNSGLDIVTLPDVVYYINRIDVDKAARDAIFKGFNRQGDVRVILGALGVPTELSREVIPLIESVGQ